MSRDASITFPWGDGETTFALRWGELAKLQEALDCGPYVLLNRLASNTWRIEDIREVIRWGLIGGGKTPVEASKQIKLYVENIPPNLEDGSNLLAALRIIGAGCVGAPDEPAPGKDRKSKDAGDPLDNLPNGKLRYAAVYGMGAAIGMSPDEVKKLSMWELFSAVEGYVKANTPDDGSLTDKEQDDLWAMVQAKSTR